MSVWRQTGIKPKELEELVDLPESCKQVWQYFLELHSSRAGNGFGANPISYTDILSYCTLHDLQLEQWELVLLRRLDNTALEHLAKEQEKLRNKK